MDNPDLVQAIVKVRAGEELSRTEAFLLDEQNLAILTDLSFVFGQVRDGLLDETAIPLAAWRVSYFEHDPLLADSWRKYKALFSADFVGWYEQNIIESRLADVR